MCLSVDALLLVQIHHCVDSLLLAVVCAGSLGASLVEICTHALQTGRVSLCPQMVSPAFGQQANERAVEAIVRINHAQVSNK